MAQRRIIEILQLMKGHRIAVWKLGKDKISDGEQEEKRRMIPPLFGERENL